MYNRGLNQEVKIRLQSNRTDQFAAVAILEMHETKHKHEAAYEKGQDDFESATS